MKTKILLGSVGTVVILIFVSFTNVVGIQSTTSNSLTDSPLFSIRANKAINNNKNNGVITSHYLGKGLNAMPFPLQDNRITLIQKVIEKIEKMDDKEFNRFQNLILSHVSKERNIKNNEIINLLTLLKLRYIPKELEINQFDMNGNKTKYPTYWDSCQFFDCNTIANWFPCLLMFLFISGSVLVHVFIVLVYWILGSLYTITLSINRTDDFQSAT